MKPLLILLALVPLSLTAAPEWIWSSKTAQKNETATFRKTFTLAGEVKSAVLMVSGDNGASAVLNGKAIFENPDWMQSTKADVKPVLKSGENELIIHGRNQGGSAALVAKLEIEAADGKKTVIETNGEWQVAVPNTKDWKPVAVIARLGSAPWGDVFNPSAVKDGKAVAAAAAEVLPAAEVGVPEGFKVELLYTVPKAEQGSWVSLTVDKQGRIIAGDQYGGLYRITVAPVGSAAKAQIDRIPSSIGGAHGLLHAFGALYVMNNEKATPACKPGLWRMKENADGTYAEPEFLRALPGGGEHGPHSMVLSPDGKRIFFNAGNHTKLPEKMELSRAGKRWDEDHILPRMWDANGHARGILAPGGYICSMDPDAKSIELFCYGFRNQFDIAFDMSGELYTYDADMEWDIGSPWYRPTRINHCVSGADYGWRSGSGKWPDYYPDSLPTTLNIGPGSPTGVVSGTGAKFPAKYQRAIFAADWTYGTMWAIHPAPEGGSVKAEKEEFVWGKPLPLTDVIVHPDGAMYFAVGGRRTQSGLYRVSYAGKESTAPAQPLPLTAEGKLRHDLEKLHDAGTGVDAIAKAWPHLASPDRHVRFAARVAIERQPVASWIDKAFAESQPDAVIEGMIALAGMGRTAPVASPSEAKPAAGSSSAPVGLASPEDAALQARIIARLKGLAVDQLSIDQQLALARAYELAFTRLGKPSAEACAGYAAILEPLYPHKDGRMNRELCQLLVFLDSTKVVAQTLSLLVTAKDDWQAIASDQLLARNTGYARAANEASSSRPNQQQISYMFALKNAKAGWTSGLRHTYFTWFPRARAWKGGNSFKGFIENTRKEALATFAPPAELAELDALSSKTESPVMANFVAPKGPGKNYTVDDVVTLAKEGLKGRNFENGRAMFTSTMCLTCHRFNGDGGSIGPDVTGAGNRYTLRDLMENIVEPSKVVSDQYDSHLIEKKDGSLVIGRIVAEENGTLQVMMNPFAPTQLTPVNAADVKSKKTQATSMMPPGLINTLNQDELLDLVAYILSAGNAQDKMFAR